MLNNQVTFRRVSAGLLLIVAPLLQALAVIVGPGTWGDDREAVSFGDNLPVLVAAVWRAGFAGWWVPAVVAAGYLGSFLVEYGPVTAIFWTVPVIGLGWLGVKVLRMGDEAWAAYYPAVVAGRPGEYAPAGAE